MHDNGDASRKSIDFVTYGRETQPRAPANSSAPTSLAPSVLMRAELWKKKLPALEKLVILAMLKHRGDGTFIWASLQRIADYCGMDRSTVQRIIRGVPARKHKDGRVRKPKLGLIQRRILAPIGKANRSLRKPASYRIQLEAAEDDPKVIAWIEGRHHHQQPLLFPDQEQEVTSWIQHNPGCWQKTVRDIKNAAASMIAQGEQERLDFFWIIATENGMPKKHADVVFAPQNWQ